jgi:quercetin dioxygenase-like cupin family protein
MPELIQRKNFDSPDERDTPWDKVHGDWVELLGEEIGRMTVEPGWTWREHAAPVAGTERCEKWHVKLFLSGRFSVAYEDGTEAVFKAGDIAVLEPGHDAWVVGDEPVVYLSLGSLFNKDSA